MVFNRVVVLFSLVEDPHKIYILGGKYLQISVYEKANPLLCTKRQSIILALAHLNIQSTRKHLDLFQVMQCSLRIVMFEKFQNNNQHILVTNLILLDPYQHFFAKGIVHLVHILRKI